MPTQRKKYSDNGVGKEIFEIHPIILGGDPIDPANKTLLTREQHIEAVRYWNRKIKELRTATNQGVRVVEIQPPEQ